MEELPRKKFCPAVGSFFPEVPRQVPYSQGALDQKVPEPSPPKSGQLLTSLPPFFPNKAIDSSVERLWSFPSFHLQVPGEGLSPTSAFQHVGS